MLTKRTEKYTATNASVKPNSNPLKQLISTQGLHTLFTPLTSFADLIKLAHVSRMFPAKSAEALIRNLLNPIKTTLQKAYPEYLIPMPDIKKITIILSDKTKPELDRIKLFAKEIEPLLTYYFNYLLPLIIRKELTLHEDSFPTLLTQLYKLKILRNALSKECDKLLSDIQNRLLKEHLLFCPYTENPEAKKLLIEGLKRLGNIDAKDITGNTTLANYAEMIELDDEDEENSHQIEKHIVHMRALIANGADIEARNNEGNTPLFNNIYYDAFIKTRFLLSAGANPNAISNTSGDPLLIFSINMNKPEATTLLLEQKTIQVDARNRKQETALMIAAKNNNFNLSEQLIAHGANANAQDINGDSVLRMAVNHVTRSGTGYDMRIIHLLLEHGADPTAKNLKGESALDLAANNAEVLALLNAHRPKMHLAR